MLALFTGCAHAPPPKGCTAFGAVVYCLQPSSVQFSATQAVEMLPIRPGVVGGTEKLIVYLEVRNGNIAMVGLTPFGQRVLQISFDAGGVVSQMPRGVPVSAEGILAGLQLAAWPLPQARAGVRGSTAQLRETPDGRVRELRDGDAVVFRATCEGERPICARADLRYEAIGQRLQIEVLESHR